MDWGQKKVTQVKSLVIKHNRREVCQKIVFDPFVSYNAFAFFKKGPLRVNI